MTEDMIARLVLVEPIDDWDRLGEMERMLQETFPGTRVDSGGLGNPLVIDVAAWRQGGEVDPPELREFVVRGPVAQARTPGGMTSERQPPADAVALVYVFYPEEPSVKEMERVAGGLKTAWQGARIEFGATRRSGLPVDQTNGDRLMEFVIRPA